MPAAHAAVKEIDSLINPAYKCVEIPVPLSDSGTSGIISGNKIFTNNETGELFMSCGSLVFSLLNYVMDGRAGCELNSSDAFMYIAPVSIFIGHDPEGAFVKADLFHGVAKTQEFDLVSSLAGNPCKIQFHSTIVSKSFLMEPFGAPIPGLTLRQTKLEMFRTLVMHEHLHLYEIPARGSKNAVEIGGTHCVNPGCTMNAGEEGNGWVKTQARLMRGYPVCDDCKRQLEQLRQIRTAQAFPMVNRGNGR